MIPGRRADALCWLLAALASGAFALSFGLNYAIDNQVVYFLEALRSNDPNVLARDWYAAEVTHYHVAITALVAPLLRWSPSGWAIGILHIVVMCAGCLAWHGVTRALLRERWLALLAFIAVLALMTATRSLGIGISYIFNEALQPSTLGSLGWLFAVLFFVKRRFLASGVALALSGLFHANFLVLGGACFGLAQLFLGGTLKEFSRRSALQLGPLLVALLVVLVPMLATVASDNAAEAQRILFQVRSPHHYQPRAFQRDLIPFLGWTCVGLSCVALLPKTAALRRLLVCTFATALVVWIGTLLTSWVYIARVAQLFVWRVAPFVDLVGQTLLAGAALRCLWWPRLWQRQRLADGVVLACAAAALCSAYAMRGQPQLAWVLAGVCGVLALGLVLQRLQLGGAWRRWAPGLGGLVVTALLLAVAYKPLSELREGSSLLRGEQPPDQELFDWVGTHTAKDALFLTPPDVRTFRYKTQRAIVVDWKSTPMLPDEVVEWFARIRDVTGKPKFAKYRDLGGYASLDTQRLRRLRDKYAVDYVLVRRAGVGRLRGLSPVFSNARWAVFDLRQWE